MRACNCGRDVGQRCRGERYGKSYVKLLTSRASLFVGSQNSWYELRCAELGPSFLPSPFPIYQEELCGIAVGEFNCQERISECEHCIRMSQAGTPGTMALPLVSRDDNDNLDTFWNVHHILDFILRFHVCVCVCVCVCVFSVCIRCVSSKINKTKDKSSLWNH